MKTILLLTGAGFLASLVLDKYVIKWDAEDDGFIPAGEGAGLDNLAFGFGTAITYWGLRKLTGKL